MNKSNIEAGQPEQKNNSEQTAQDSQVSQPNANTNVVGSLLGQREIKIRYRLQHLTRNGLEEWFEIHSLPDLERGSFVNAATAKVIARSIFTGQRYNGTELYEDDIVEIEYYEEMIKDHPLNGFNPFGEDKQKPIIRLICDYGWDSSFHLKRIDDKSHACYSVQFGGSAVKSKKIIGNRFENPELLETLR